MKRFVFTTHKAASTLLVQVCRATSKAVEANWRTANTNTENRLSEPWRPEDAEQFSADDTLYGPLRYPLSSDIIKGSPTVLHLRDPRDVLVSLYFSEAFSHVNRDEASRQAIQSQGVDAFVLERANQFVQRYRTYLARMMGDAPVTLLSYEDLIETPERWCAQYVAGIAPDLPFGRKKALAGRLVDIVNPTDTPDSATEDVTKHVRKRTPGDHREKLKPETIAALETDFAETLTFLGYTSSAQP